MNMDQTTETVAHFIGLFHLTVEQDRLRDLYEKTEYLRNKDAEAGQLLHVSVNVSSDLQPEGYAPVLEYGPPDPEAPPALPGLFLPVIPDISFAVLPDLPAAGVEAPRFFTQFPNLPAAPSFTLEPASSVVVVTYQFNGLDDDDYLMMKGQTQFSDPALHGDMLDILVQVAEAAHGPVTPGGLPALPDSAAALESVQALGDYARALQDAVETAEAPQITGLTAHVIRGEAAHGIFVNGKAAAEMITLDDVMPAFLSPAEDDTTDPAAGGDGDLTPAQAAKLNHPADDPMDDLFDVDPGHLIVTGANQSINEAYTGQAWLDAPVIAVKGDAITLNVIAQINILMDHNAAPSAGTAHTGDTTGGQPPQVLNQAVIEILSSAQLAADQAAEAGEEIVPGYSGLPKDWVVTKITADVIAVNWVKQVNFATDTDRAEVVLSGWETYIDLGNNQLVNLQGLVELGYGYDLILIGGHYYSVNMLSQINVLLDNDTVTYSGLPPTAVQAGDNLLFNSAAIHAVGADTYEELGGPFAQAIDDLGNGANNIGAAVAQDSIFVGTELLRVLYIEGDLTLMNLFEQTNVLGDADEVHLALEDFVNVTGGEVTVHTGSNALVNSATLKQFGVDSVIMAGGAAYDDALIYQAELIDTDAAPSGVTLSQLANEAVAFLADDMLDPETSQTEDAPMQGGIDDGSTPVDILQTVLA